MPGKESARQATARMTVSSSFIVQVTVVEWHFRAFHVLEDATR